MVAVVSGASVHPDMEILAYHQLAVPVILFVVDFDVHILL